MTKKGKTAKELLDELGRDPKFIARQEAQEQARKETAAQFALEEELLVADLRRVGIVVRSAWDLVNTSEPYPRALPVLLEHLQRPYSGLVKEGIARALAVRDARFAWHKLKQLYTQEKDQRAKDGLAVALAATADEEVMDELIELARDRQQGTGRVLLLRPLEKSNSDRARKALMNLATDPDLEKEIQAIFRRQKITKH